MNTQTNNINNNQKHSEILIEKNKDFINIVVLLITKNPLTIDMSTFISYKDNNVSLSKRKIQ